ncbi:MAG: hypothetical protein WKG06_37080 [Segetibacter sp.]
MYIQKSKLQVDAERTCKRKKSKLVQIMNEVDDLTDEEKSFVLYWLKAKKNAQAAAQADSTIILNNITPEDIYKERNTVRKQKA